MTLPNFNELNHLSDKELLGALSVLTVDFQNKSGLDRPMRSYFNIMSDTLGSEQFTARGIRNNFNKDWAEVFNLHYLNINSVNNLIELTSRQKVEQLYINLTMKLNEFLFSRQPTTTMQPTTATATATATQPQLTPITGELSEVRIKQVQTFVEMWLEEKSGFHEQVKKDVAANFSDVKAMIELEAKKLNPIEIHINHKEPQKITGNIHKCFELALNSALLERQVFLSGPAGTGKTTLAAQVAKALGVKFSHISCTAGMSEAHLIGQMTANGEFVSTDFVDMYENGGLFLLDEVDAADSNTMMVINSALANGSLSVPKRSENRTARRHDEFYCFCCANTWGYGSSEYVGRNVLDQAFLDRFPTSRIYVDYDVKLEEKLSAQFPSVAITVWTIRENVAKNKIRRVVSTRAVISGNRLLSNGANLKTFVEYFTTGWTTEEKNKALQGVSGI